MTWQELEILIIDFSEKLNSALRELGILNEVSLLSADHVGLRLKENTQVDALKQEMLSVGDIISATDVNGREIIIFQLRSPLQVGTWSVCGVEVPYPKPGHAYQDGWEHIEFVLSESENSMDALRNEFFRVFPQLTKEALEEKYAYKEDVPHAEGDQMTNPSICLKVNGVGIKFHANPIQVVVGYQNV